LLLREAIDSSLEHLRRWMIWAHDEPRELKDTTALLRQFRGQFDLGQDFVYGIFDPDETRVVGGTGLHTRGGDEAYEIGYWIRASDIGQGLATEATAALTRVAFDLCGVERVDINVELGNESSMAIPRKLGFLEEAVLRRRLPGHGDEPKRDMAVFALFREDFAGSPAATAEVEAHDVSGARVL
jgi:RimJ/RimL family protein N-acetyltransferase